MLVVEAVFVVVFKLKSSSLCGRVRGSVFVAVVQFHGNMNSLKKLWHESLNQRGVLEMIQTFVSLFLGS